MKTIKAWALIKRNGELTDRNHEGEWAGPLIWLKKADAKADSYEGERVVRVTIQVEDE